MVAVSGLRARDRTVRRRIEELSAELATLHEERDAVAERRRRELSGARRRRPAAVRRAAEATAARERALARLEELDGAPDG